MDRPLVITGAPRSGTTFTARHLNSKRVKVGHEDWRKEGVVSWKMLFEADPAKHFIIHLIRDPLKAIPSIMSIKPASRKVFASYGAFDEKEEAYLKAAKIWLFSVEKAETLAHLTVLVETLKNTRLSPRINSRGRQTHGEYPWGAFIDKQPELLGKILTWRSYFYGNKIIGEKDGYSYSVLAGL